MPGDLIEKQTSTRVLPSEERLPASGEYWRCTKRLHDHGPTLDGVYLVTHVHVIDGEMHSLQLGEHPEECRGWRVMIDEFLESFEFAPDGQQVRDAEMAEVARRIEALQQQISAPPPNIQQMLETTNDGEASLVTDLISRGTTVQAMQDQAARIGTALAQHAERIKGVSKSIGEETQTLARYHGERANAAIAQVTETMARAEHLQKGVKTLGLFAGDDVEVNTLLEGEPAATDEPLTIYQRRLYLDEELLCRLDEGGADFRDDDTFAQMLAGDPDLLARIMPAQRGVVLMRYRRNSKIRQHDPKADLLHVFSRVMQDVAEDEASAQSFLVVRNGGNVHQIFADEALKPIERLFPRAEDVEEIYRERGWRFSGIESRTITVKDLDYVERRGKFENMALLFRRVLTLLWGLDNRLNLFGEFYDRRRHPTMLSMEFQQAHMRFVADEENVLDDPHPRFQFLQSAQNQLIQPGSRIAIRWRDAMDSASCPGAVRERKDARGDWTDHFVYAPASGIGIATVRKSRDRLVVKVPCRHTGYGSEDERSFEIDLSKADRTSFFCIDGCTSDELAWYINSRRERQNYIHYVRILQEAVKLLREEEEREKDALADLRERAGGPANSKALATAFRMWRASVHGAGLPIDKPKALEAVKRSILKAAEVITDGAVRGDAAERALEEQRSRGRRPFRVGMRIDGSFLVDSQPSPEESLAYVPNAWFVRTGADRTGAAHRREEWRAPAREADTTVQVFQQEASFAELPWKSATYAEAFEIDRAMEDIEGSPLYQMLTELGTTASQHVARAARAANYDRDRLAWTRSFLPVALVEERATSDGRLFGDMRLVGISASPFDLVALSGEAGMASVRHYVETSYRMPESHLRHLDGITRSTVVRPTVGRVREFLEEGRYNGGYGRHWETRTPDAGTFDTREGFLDTIGTGSSTRKLVPVAWSRRADDILALARIYTHTSNGE